MKNEDKMMMMLETLVSKVTIVESKVTAVEAKLTAVEQEQAEINKCLKKIETAAADQAADMLDIKEKVISFSIAEFQMCDDIKRTRAETARIRESVAVIEVEHGKHLRGLGDGFALLDAKLEPLPEAIEKLQADVSLVKAATSVHGKEIRELKLAE